MSSLEENNCESSQEDKTPGIFSWRELVTQDVGKSTSFYTELMGWKVDSMDMGNGMVYNMFMQGERPIAGMVQNPQEGAPSTWMNYITVENLEASLEKAKSLGATETFPIMEVPGKGRFAGILDPQGAAIAFWQFV